ncbi:hypothetical protein H9L39_00678 [Fusarium oxysporum f. sp. albedinis]|nr:hypothetical protein H9L39_00678 [Fusarium oxysporum f. sp. albedinis]
MSTAQCNYIHSDRQPQTTWCSLPPPSPFFLMCMVASPFHPDKVQAVVYQHSLRHHATMDPLETRKGVLDQSGPALRLEEQCVVKSTETKFSYLDTLKQMFLAVCRYPCRDKNKAISYYCNLGTCFDLSLKSKKRPRHVNNILSLKRRFRQTPARMKYPW